MVDMDLFNRLPDDLKVAVKHIYRDNSGYSASLRRGYKLEGYCTGRKFHETTFRSIVRILRDCLVKDGEARLWAW